MSQDNVEAFKRAIEAYNRRDMTRSGKNSTQRWSGTGALQAVLEGKATVYRGHEGVRQWLRDIDEALAEIRLALLETVTLATDYLFGAIPLGKED